MVKCCKDCQKRHVGCHGQCPEYQKHKADHVQKRIQIINEKHQQEIISDVQFHSRKKKGQNKYG